MSMHQFAETIVAFNKMYRLPVSISPVLSWHQATLNSRGDSSVALTSSDIQEHWATQVNNFLNILREELDESEELLESFEDEDGNEADEFDMLTAIADWLGDVAVYCMSEATKYGVADYVPEFIYQDHAEMEVFAYNDLRAMEAGVIVSAEALINTVDYNEQLLIGQPSAKNMAKFLTTMISRCFYTAEHYGFDLYEVLKIIMDSNMSKLGADGQPIYDERGKVQKGPGYWKPEPKIREYLTGLFLLDDTESEEDDDDLEDEDMEDELDFGDEEDDAANDEENRS